MNLLDTISFDEAKKLSLENLLKLKRKEMLVNIEDALGLTLAQDIISNYDIPHFKRSMVDGYAVNYEDILGAKETSPIFLRYKDEIKMGEAYDKLLNEDECVLVQTGSAIPLNASGVVMIEYTTKNNQNVAIYKNLRMNENIVMSKEEFQKGDFIFKKNHQLSAFDIGILSSLGIKKVLVYAKYIISIISTGDELLSSDDSLKTGCIYDVNTNMLKAICLKYGLIINQTKILKDDYALIKQTIKYSLDDSDIILVSGGSSKGIKDYTSMIFDELCNGLVFHGVRVKPGKPTILAFDDTSNTLLCGLPGHPLAAYLIFKELIIDNLNNHKEYLYKKCLENINNSSGRTEILLVKIIDDKIMPIYAKSGLISKMANADGYIILDENLEGYLKDEEVRVYLL